MPIDYVPGLPPVPAGMTAGDVTILREQLQEDTLQILLKYIDAKVSGSGGAVDGDRNYWETHVQDWGAVADGQYSNVSGLSTGTDNSAAFQRAIDHAIYTGHTKVVVDPGKYRLGRGLHAGYGELFHAVVIEGSNYWYGAFGEIFCGAALIPDFVNEPCINIQGARGTVIRGIAIVGKLFSWVYQNSMANGDATPLLDDTNPDNWDATDAFWGTVQGLAGPDTGRVSKVDSRYAPYAAITIDAYSGVRPAVSYPDVDYPVDTGIVTQYGKGYSSDVLLEDLMISGFTVGIANQPCDADGNGDFTVLRRLNMDCCKWGLSVGNTQSRNVGIADVKFSQMYCMLTNCKHGHRSGKFNGAVINLSGGQSIKVFEFEGTSITGPIAFTNLYAEAMWKLGDVSAPTAVENSIRFVDTMLSFEMQNETRGIPTYILGGAAQSPINVVMEGCAWNNFRNVWNTTHRITTNGAIFYRWDLGQFVAQASYQQHAYNFLCGGFMMPPTVPWADVNHKIHWAQYNLDTGADALNVETGPSFRYADRTTCIPIYARSVMARSNGYRYEDLNPQQSGFPVDKTISLSSVTLVNRVLTLGFVSLPDWFAETYGLMPGDVLWESVSGTVFFIRSRTGTTVVAEQQNNYKSDGVGGYVTIDTVDLVNGYFYACNSRLYTPGYSTIGDLTLGSPVIAAAGRADAYAGHLENEIAVGDRMFIDKFRDYPFNESASKVTARSNAGATVTLDSNALYTQARKPLPFFIRAAPANRGTR